MTLPLRTSRRTAVRIALRLARVLGLGLGCRIRSVLCACLVLGLQPAQASGQPGAAHWHLGLRQAATQFDGLERREDGGLFNQDRGWLHGAELLLQRTGARQAGDVSAWQLQLGLSRLSGDLAYQGVNQMGLPISTRTGLRREQAEALVHLHLQLPWAATGWQARLGAGLRGLQQQRHIHAGPLNSALTERLSQRQLVGQIGLGTAGQVAGRRVSLQVLAEGNRPVAQQLWVEPDGAFDPVRLQPSRQSGWALTLQTELALSNRAVLHLALAGRHERPGPSGTQLARRNGLPVGALRYPGSLQRLHGVSMGVDWRL